MYNIDIDKYIYTIINWSFHVKIVISDSVQDFNPAFESGQAFKTQNSSPINKHSFLTKFSDVDSGETLGNGPDLTF